MKFHARARHRLKTFGAQLAEGTAQFGGLLDKGVGHVHRAVQHINPDLVDTVAGREAGNALRHTRTALQGYETARAIVTGGRRA